MLVIGVSSFFGSQWLRLTLSYFQHGKQNYFTRSSGIHHNDVTWVPWRFNMMTLSNGNIFRVTGPLCREFTGHRRIPSQRPVTRSFDAFFDLRLNKRLSKQSWVWWFEKPSCSLWRHCNESHASELFVRPFVQSNNKEDNRSALLFLCEGNPSITGEFPSHRTSNEVNITCDDVIMWQGLTQDSRLKIQCFICTFFSMASFNNKKEAQTYRKIPTTDMRRDIIETLI